MRGSSASPIPIARRRFLRLLTLAGTAATFSRRAFADLLLTNKFVFARLRYSGGDWDTDMQGQGMMGGSELQFLERLTANTRIPAEIREFVISPGDPAIGNYPFLYITGHGEVQLTGTQMEGLHAAVMGGGFLFGEDCTGAGRFRRTFMALMDQIFPENKVEILPMDHPVFHCLYDINEILGGDKLVHDYMEGITIGDRLAVIYTDNDLGCAWEGHPCGPHGEKQREHAFQVGMNIVAYALTH